MRKSDKIEEKILDAALWGAVIWGGIAIVSHMERQARGTKGTSGIGDLTAWNKRNLGDFFERTMWNDKVVVNKGAQDDRGYYPVDFIYGGHKFAGMSCLVSPNNIDYLKELCRIYNCEYIEMRGGAYYPNVHEIY